LLREALTIKTELDVLKQSQKQMKSRRKSSSRSTLNATPLHYEQSLPRVESHHAPARQTVDDWYNDVDVSVSSTGSEIRRRLYEDLKNRNSYKDVMDLLKETPLNEDVSPIAFSENYPQNGAQSYQMFTPHVHAGQPARTIKNEELKEAKGIFSTQPVSMAGFENSNDSRSISSYGSQQQFVPAWVARNPHLANLYDPARLGSVQLPPLFRNPIAVGSAQLTSWSIPPPVLYGLGQGRPHFNN
jgi:hypothetical protein